MNNSRHPARRNQRSAVCRSLVAFALFLTTTIAKPLQARADPQDDPIAIAANTVLASIARTGTSTIASERIPALAAADTSYVPQLRSLADEINRIIPVDPDELIVTWTTTDPRRLKVILTALSHVGTPYRYGGNQPGGFDCSGLTSYVWGTVGIRIPRTSGSQIAATTPRTIPELEPGDLLWRPGHIGMSIGYEDVMVNATQTGKPVEVKRAGRIVRAGSPLN